MGDHPLRKHRLRQNLSIEALAKATGLSKRTILRAEQWHNIQPSSRHILCTFFQLDPIALGLLPANRGADHLGEDTFLFDISDMDAMNRKRRELLRLLSVAGALLVVPLPIEVDWDHVQSAVARPSSLDIRVTQDLEVINQQYWSVFRTSPSKRVVLDGVLGQLRVLTEFLRITSSESMRQRIGVLASDLSQLAGEIFFDSSDYDAAQSCYTFAATIAHEANAHDLWASALIRNAFLPLYERQYDEAFTMVRQARKLATKGDTTLVTRFWAAAVEADAQAGLSHLVGCQRALDVAEEVQRLKGGANGTWLRFDGERLAEQRGACFVKLGKPDLAEAALQIALKQPTITSIRRRGLILSDLAIAAVQRQDIERACQYGTDILAGYREGGSGVLKKSLFRLQQELQPFQRVAAVRELGQHLQLVTATNAR